MRDSATEVRFLQKADESDASKGKDARDKLERSMRLAEKERLRTIRCPVCGFYLLDVYGKDHYLVRIKCQKCKFDETIDTALFRTMKKRNS